ncbi:Ketol-acid reductoisomerase (NADP(+)) [Frankliniella fusca]|uniref:Ketol-acid reductoisomerase (NADP(+)) n=1 Tax=Frankliniella fusca TaxID=407009 RepID=A0AAE1HZJ2_9NEOP|nr:Ketol-acid reductoisomerase (NADP(+)) [Frankliniella fusca]
MFLRVWVNSLTLASTPSHRAWARCCDSLSDASSGRCSTVALMPGWQSGGSAARRSCAVLTRSCSHCSLTRSKKFLCVSTEWRVSMCLSPISFSAICSHSEMTRSASRKFCQQRRASCNRCERRGKNVRVLKPFKKKNTYILRGTYRLLLLRALCDGSEAVGERRHVLLELLRAPAGLRVLVGRGLHALEHVEQHLHLAVEHRLVVRQPREEGPVTVELGLHLLSGAGRRTLAQHRVGLVEPGRDLTPAGLQGLLLDQHLVVQVQLVGDLRAHPDQRLCGDNVDGERVHHGVDLLTRQVLDEALERLADDLEQLLHALDLGLQLLQLLAVRLDALGRAQLEMQVGEHRLGAAQPALQALHAVVELAAEAEQVAGVHVLLHVAEHLVPARRQLGERVAERARHPLIAGGRQEADRVREQRQLVPPHAQVLEEALALVLGQALQGVRGALQPVLQLLRERGVPPPRSLGFNTPLPSCVKILTHAALALVLLDHLLHVDERLVKLLEDAVPGHEVGVLLEQGLDVVLATVLAGPAAQLGLGEVEEGDEAALGDGSKQEGKLDNCDGEFLR